MATTLRVDKLYMQGEPDIEHSIKIDRAEYENLPVFPKGIFDRKEWVIEKHDFSEIYRGHREDANSYHKAIRFYNPNDTHGTEYTKDRNKYYYCVWIAKEGCWIMFKYKDLTTADDMFLSTVEVCIPSVGEIYRPSEEIFEIIKEYDV